MMPRRISVVPPWMVSFGAIKVAPELLLKRGAIARTFLDEGRQLAGAMRQGLLPDRANVLHDCRLHHGFLARMQHARYRHRHAPQGMDLRDQPTQSLGTAYVGIGAEYADQFLQHVKGFEKALRSATLVGQFGGRLFPGAVDCA